MGIFPRLAHSKRVSGLDGSRTYYVHKQLRSGKVNPIRETSARSSWVGITARVPSSGRRGWRSGTRSRSPCLPRLDRVSGKGQALDRHAASLPVNCGRAA